jgi:chloride channel protein, CIC family
VERAADRASREASVRARRLGSQARGTARTANARWERWLERFERRAPSENAILLSFAVAVGIAAALGVVAFYKAIDLAYRVFFALPAELLPNTRILAYRPVVTAAAVAAAWALWRRVGRGDDGLTVPDVQLAVVRRGGAIPAGRALARTAASAITVGGGGSAGNEGPVAVLGAAAGSLLGRAFRFSAERTTVLVGAGTAAAIAAAFNAPLAGAFFALEEILGSFRVRMFSPVVIASVVGAVVSRAMFGNHPAFPIPREYGYTLVREVAVFFPLLGVVCGGMAALFARLHFAAGDAARALRARPGVPPVAVPLAAGALVGAAVFASGGLLVGEGHLAIPLAAFGRMAWWALLLLAVGKIAVTAVTLQGGGSGGLFTPSLFVGAATGGAFGVALRALFPALPISPEAYALVGMGAVVAAATGAPITGILLVFEMTNDYAIVLPLMIAVVITQLVARALSPDNLYTGWLRRRGEHLEHGADRDALSGLRVADALDADAVVAREATPVAALLDHIGHRHQTVFPVIDEDGVYLGVITTTDLGTVARSDHALDAVLLAADVAQPTETLAPGDSLLEAVRRMGVRGEGSLPVVDRATGRLAGVVSRSHILGLYERAVAAAPHPSTKEPDARPR